MRRKSAELRALRQLSDRRAEELVERPIQMLVRLRTKGLAFISRRYPTPHHGMAIETSISEAGCRLLQESLS